MSHQNDGACKKCAEIFAAYPHVYTPLQNWFRLVQAKFPSFHTSCAGRGREAQEMCFNNRASLAHYGQSAHNYNAAFDGWFLVNGLYNGNLKDQDLHDLFLQIYPEIPDYVVWYGYPGAKFYEMAHYEIRDWKDKVDRGVLDLVEPT